MTDQERKAMEMAFDALNDLTEEFRGHDLPYGSKAYNKATGVINSLRQALNVDAIDTSSTYVDKNEKREHEPVAWLHPDKKVDVVVPSKLAWFDKPLPLYTAPPSKPWVSLTDEERVKAFVDAGLEIAYMDYDADMKISSVIEAKLKERNT